MLLTGSSATLLHCTLKVDPTHVILDGEPLPWVNPLNLLLHKPEGLSPIAFTARLSRFLNSIDRHYK